jgi:hypothetical protein
MEKTETWRLTEYSPPNEPQERWYFRKNLTPRISSGDLRYSFLAYLTFHWRAVSRSGFPARQDDDTLARIEREKFSALVKDDMAVHVGTVTKPGTRDFLFYTRDSDEFLSRASQMRALYKEFQISCELFPDPGWSQYEDLP